MEYGERHSQPYYREYDWLVPYVTQNTQGLYIRIFPEVLINPTHMLLMTGPKLVLHYTPYVWRLKKYLYDRTFSTSVKHMT